MPRKILLLLGATAVCCPLGSPLPAARNPADYPLRVHIYQFRGNSHFSGGTLDYDQGEGQANLYENGEPHGFDFKFQCPDRLRRSIGWETYSPGGRDPEKAWRCSCRKSANQMPQACPSPKLRLANLIVFSMI